MAKHPGQNHPEDSHDPQRLPGEPPMDDIEEIVEFVDEDIVAEPIEFGFEDEPTATSPLAPPPLGAPSGGAPPGVPLASPIPKPAANERDSVLDDDLIDIGQAHGFDAGQVSGVFSSVIRAEPLSNVLGNSEIIRAEPLSDTVALDPLSDIAAMKADSEIRAESAMPVMEIADFDDVDVVEDAVLDDEAPRLSTSEIALPESAVREEALVVVDDDVSIGEEILTGIDDSSVLLKSFKGRNAPEKEPVLDLDDTMAGLDSPHPKILAQLEPTVAFDGGASDDVEFHDLVADVEIESSAVNLGQKPARKPGQSGIDPVAEELESGVRLDSEAPKPQRAASPPSVEFDDLIVDETAAVDLGADDDTLRPLPQSGKMPSSSFDDMPAMVDEVVDVDEFAHKATVAEDDIDIEALLGDGPTEVGAAVDEEIPVVDEEPPVTTPKRGKKPAVSADVDAAPMPYQEPKKRGWGGLIGGVVLGGLLTAGAGAGVWFAAPELITGPANAIKQPVIADGKGVAKTPLQLAHEAMDQGDFAEAVALLKDDKSDNKALLAARGEAALYAYIKKQNEEKAPINADDPEVKLAMADLMKSENPLKREQLQKALGSKNPAADPDQAKKLEDAIKDLKAAIAEKDAAEKTLANVAKPFVDAKVLAEGDKLDEKTIQKIAKDLGETKASLDAVNKLLDGAKIDDAGDKGVEKLVAAKKDFEDKLADVNKALAGAKVKDPGAKGLLELLASRDKFAKDHEELDQTIKAAFQELAEGKLVAADGDPRKDMIAGAKAARSKSESPLSGPLSSLANSLGSVSFGVGDLVKNAFGDAAAVGEINFYRLRESFVPTPEQQLDRLAAALSNREVNNAALVGEANKLAEWVVSQEAKYPPAVKAKALYVLGLGLRNQEKYLEAKQALQTAADAVKDADSPWAAQVRRALGELSDPNVYYIPRIEKLRAANDSAGALKELNAALLVIPDHPRLKAERGLIGLEKAKGEIDEKTRTAIRGDAEVAARDPKTAASGNFVLGKLEEQSGNLPKAEEHFRQALKAVSDDDEQAAHIRLSLGRLLLRDRAPGAAAPAVPKKEEKEAEKEVGVVPASKVSAAHPLIRLFASTMIAQVPAADGDETPEFQARFNQVIELANKLLDSKDPKTKAQGYLLKGEALSRLGQRTEGLRLYAKGIDLLVTDSQLTRLLDDHPSLSVPEGSQRANPLLAEKHYGVGLHLYHQRHFAEAETQFQQAITYFDKDARYYYFLGLAQMEQGTKQKRDFAMNAWEQASRLEANSRPNTREINLTLERIQGDRRAMLNAFRAKATGQ